MSDRETTSITFDASTSLLDARFDEGEHHLVTSPKGLQLFARVKNGEVTEYRAMDADGKPAQVIAMRALTNPPPVFETQHGGGGGSSTPPEVTECYVCIRDPRTGEFICWPVECRKVPPEKKPGT